MSKRLVAAPDKFRGTATAAAAAAAVVAAARAQGWNATPVPVSDGGEGLLDCFGGANRTTWVTGPQRTLVKASWRLDGTRAVIAMSEASGIALVAGQNDPLTATSQGTGELIAAAIEAGATEIVVGVGGSASTDGGREAVEVLRPFAPLDGTHGPHVVVAADVTTRFVDAARLFGPQKGATAAQVSELTDRLERVAAEYRSEFGVDIEALDGSGAAGGLAGGLAALGATIRPGFDVIAETVDLPRHVESSSLVVTGEGRLDATSLLGKAPVRVALLAHTAGVPCLLIAGCVADDFDRAALPPSTRVVSLTERCGTAVARAQTAEAVERAVREHLAMLDI